MFRPPAHAPVNCICYIGWNWLSSFTEELRMLKSSHTFVDFWSMSRYEHFWPLLWKLLNQFPCFDIETPNMSDQTVKEFEVQRGNVLVIISGRSRNFKTGGRGPSAEEFLGSENCWCSFTHTQCILVRVENKVNIVNIVWWLQLKHMHVIQSKFTNTNPPNKFKRGGGAPGAPMLDPPLNNHVFKESLKVASSNIHH